MLSIYFAEETKQICNDYCNGFSNNGSNVQGMLSWVNNRIENKFKIFINLKKNKNVVKLLNELREKLTNEKVLKILESKPKELIHLWNSEFKIYQNLQITYSYENNGKNKFKTVNALYHIFNYDSFRGTKTETQFNGFMLSKRLGIDCCPYCNRNFTISSVVNTDKQVFPEFDHFYHKKEYPLLAISFYNLIPSCNICNTHFKGSKNSVNYDIFHPYTLVKSNHFNFKSFPNDVSSLYGASANISLQISYNECDDENRRLFNSIQFFGIKDLYENSHTDLIKEIIYKKLAFSERYIKELQNTYKMSFEDSYKIVFETNFEDDKLHKNPFSKLKKDIYLGKL